MQNRQFASGKDTAHPSRCFLGHPSCSLWPVLSLADFYAGKYLLGQHGDRSYTWLVAHHVCQILVIITQKSHWSSWVWLEPHPHYSDCSDENKNYFCHRMWRKQSLTSSTPSPVEATQGSHCCGVLSQHPTGAATWHWEMSVTKPVILQGLVGKPCLKGRKAAATIGERNMGKVYCPRRCRTLEQTCSLCCRFRFLCEWFKWAWAWVINHHWIWQTKI